MHTWYPLLPISSLAVSPCTPSPFLTKRKIKKNYRTTGSVLFVFLFPCLCPTKKTLCKEYKGTTKKDRETETCQRSWKQNNTHTQKSVIPASDCPVQFSLHLMLPFSSPFVPFASWTITPQSCFIIDFPSHVYLHPSSCVFCTVQDFLQHPPSAPKSKRWTKKLAVQMSPLPRSPCTQIKR